MFRFTIRDLLWLTVVIALGVGWWLDRSQLKRSLEGDHWYTLAIALEDMLQREGFTVDDQGDRVVVEKPGTRYVSGVLTSR